MVNNLLKTPDFVRSNPYNFLQVPEDKGLQPRALFQGSDPETEDESELADGVRGGGETLHTEVIIKSERPSSTSSLASTPRSQSGQQVKLTFQSRVQN